MKIPRSLSRCPVGWAAQHLHFSIRGLLGQVLVRGGPYPSAGTWPPYLSGCSWSSGAGPPPSHPDLCLASVAAMSGPPLALTLLGSLPFLSHPPSLSVSVPAPQCICPCPPLPGSSSLDSVPWGARASWRLVLGVKGMGQTPQGKPQFAPQPRWGYYSLYRKTLCFPPTRVSILLESNGSFQIKLTIGEK